MATITRLRDIRKPKTYNPLNRLIKYYNSSIWKNLSYNHRIEQPLDELLLLEDIISPTEDVHHIVPFSSGINELEKWWLLQCPDNIISVSKKTHVNIHYHQERLTDKQRCHLKAKANEIKNMMMLELYVK